MQASLRTGDDGDSPVARGPEPADLVFTRTHLDSDLEFLNEFKMTPAQRARAHRASLRTRAEKSYGVKRSLTKRNSNNILVCVFDAPLSLQACV
jgi:hypothetical protein